MRRINFDNLRKCEPLFNIQKNKFDFDSGLIYGDCGEYYPMPITVRDLVLEGHYSKAIDENTPKKLSKFNYQSYIKGLEVGYSEPLPKDNAAVFELATKEVYLSYFPQDMVCETHQSNNFGVAVGRLYHAWVYIADNVEEFSKVWNAQKEMDKKANRTFAEYLTFEDKSGLIEKIKAADRSTPKNIYIILKALFDNGILVMNNNETIYEMFYAEFGYHKSYDSLKTGLNYYTFEKPDTKNEQKIINMYEHLTS